MERSGKHWRVLLDGVSYIVSPKYHKPEIGDIVIVTAIKSGEILVDKAP